MGSTPYVNSTPGIRRGRFGLLPPASALTSARTDRLASGTSTTSLPFEQLQRTRTIRFTGSCRRTIAPDYTNEGYQSERPLPRSARACFGRVPEPTDVDVRLR